MRSQTHQLAGRCHRCTRQPLHLCNSIGKVSGLVGRQRPAADTASLHIAREYTHSSSTSHKAASSNAGGSPGSKADTRRVSQSEASAYQKAGRGGSHQQVYSGSNRHGPATSLKERQPARPLPHQQQQRQLQQEPLDTVVATRKLPELLPLTMEQQQQDHVLLQPAITASAAGTTGTLKSDNLLSMNCTSTSSGKNGLSAASRLQLQQQQRPRLSNRLLTKPEVLSPAGGWQQLRAAVENGADAVYFGVTGFNARARAANFEPGDLPAVMSYLHARGVKGYVALNILVFDAELSRLETLVRQLASAGVDAVIVQDVGAVSLIRRVAPQLPIHGSTQMSITSAEGAQFAAGLGVTRVVVGRELSIREISQLSSNTTVDVEAFCHGALCVSYSGQCYSSEAWGGRSANRGQCAQACRMPYGLIVDGQLKDLQDISYLLSPQDLMALDHVGDMVAAGVGCFKIEGRLKGPEYVAATTAAYKTAVDAAWDQILLAEQQQQDRITSNSCASTSSDSSTSSSTTVAVSSRASRTTASANTTSSRGTDAAVLTSLAQVFSRGQDESFNGLTPGFLEGSQHQRLVRGRAPRHRGLCLGRVSSVTKRGVIIHGLVNMVKRGDGLVFDHGRPEVSEEGGSVWDLFVVADHHHHQQQQQQRARSRDSGASKGSHRSSGSKGRSKKIEGAAARGRTVELVFGPGQVDLSSISVGDLVWKTRDPAMESQLRSTYEAVSSSNARKLPVKVSVSGSVGSPLTLTLADADGRSVTADTGDVLLQPAAKRPMSADDVVAAVGQLGDNVLTPESVDVSGLAYKQGLFLPASAFKSVRRAAADQLLALRQQHHYAQDLAQHQVLPQLLSEAAAAAAVKPSTVSANDTSMPNSTHVGRVDQYHTSQQQRHNTNKPSSNIRTTRSPQLRVLCRAPGQVQAALEVPWLEEVIVDFLEVHGLKEAVAAVRAAGKRVVVALPRILKPGESRLLWFYLKLGADALLLRGAGSLQQLLALGGPGATVANISALDNTCISGAADPSTDSSSTHIGNLTATTSSTSSSEAAKSSTSTINSSNSDPHFPSGSPSTSAAAPGSSAAASGAVVIPRLEGDFSLNAANVLAADLLLTSGLSRLCLTHDLNAGQLAQLAQGLGTKAEQLEVICHQHLPIFHTEHCVFCRFLSDGNSYLDCGHPCERHTVQLRDSTGGDHLVLADMGCRNTVFNASAQSGLYYVPRLTAAGFGTFRIELVNEQPEVIRDLSQRYRDVLDGNVPPGHAWEWLTAESKGGVSAGSLEVKKERAVSSLRPTARRV